MDTTQNTSWVTILIRLSACAIMGVGIMLLFLGLFMSHGTASMCLARGLVIGFATALLAINPRKSVNDPVPNPDGPPE